MRKLLLLIEICLLAWLLTGSARYEAKKEIPVNTPEFDWENYNIITHALGGIDGLTYLNSRESFINYYDKGCRLFEVDLTQTSDGVWVCRHNWKESLGQWEGEERKVLSSEEFLNTPIYGKYTPMTFEDLLKLLDEYPDAFVTIDSKQYSVRNYQRTLEDYAQYREIAINAGLEHTLGQIIPELYNSAMYSGTTLVYKFPAYLYSLWQEYSIEELNDIADFCQANQIQAVSLYCEYWSEDVQKIFDERDILVYIYTINDEEKAREMTQKLKKNQFDFDDYLESIKQMKNMGGLGNIMNMLPGLGGMGSKMKGLDDEQTAEAERKMGRMEAIIHSMTPAERANPDILSPSRKHRIAKGAGVDISEVNRMIKQFNEMKKLMKQFGKPGKKKKFGFPF